MFAFATLGRAPASLARRPRSHGHQAALLRAVGPHFIFASEVRTLLGTGLLRNRLDKVGLTNFLTFGSAYDPYTPVEGIYALPAGHALTWEAGKVTEHAYWDLVDGLAPTENSSSPENEDIAIEHLRSALDQVVQMQLVSDVPVGIFLSGGIDSSALVSILARKGVKPSTFSIVFREADFSEAKHSRAVAAKFGTDHHEITVSQSDVLAAIPDAMRAMDQPTMDGINTYFVSRETSRPQGPADRARDGHGRAGHAGPAGGDCLRLRPRQREAAPAPRSPGLRRHTACCRRGSAASSGCGGLPRWRSHTMTRSSAAFG